MMSQESPNDLIEAVTAEIEAIIQEEINSQSSFVIPEEAVIGAEAVVSEVQQVEHCNEIVELTEPVENTSEEIKIVEEPSEATQTEILPATEEQSIQNEVSLLVVEQSIQNGALIEEVQEQNSGQQIEIQEDATLQTENLSEVHEEIVPHSENIVDTMPVAQNEELAEIFETVVTEVNEEKEEIVAEYTVPIGSPSQEKTAIPEVDESLVAIPLIETILKDAPVDENDGPRAKHFKQALRKALNNTVKSCSGEKLESCFPFNLKSDQFSQINSTILTALKSVIDGVQEPFEEFLKVEKLVEKLNKVDEFTRSRVPGTSEVSEAAVIASLTPQNLIDRKLYSTKLASLSKLEQFTQKLEMENSQLSSELNKRHTEFADRLDRLKSSQQLLDAALDQISTISMDDLEVLVDKMNHQYQPSALKFQN